MSSDRTVPCHAILVFACLAATESCSPPEFCRGSETNSSCGEFQRGGACKVGCVSPDSICWWVGWVSAAERIGAVTLAAHLTRPFRRLARLRGLSAAQAFVEREHRQLVGFPVVHADSLPDAKCVQLFVCCPWRWFSTISVGFS